MMRALPLRPTRIPSIRPSGIVCRNLDNLSPAAFHGRRGARAATGAWPAPTCALPDVGRPRGGVVYRVPRDPGDERPDGDADGEIDDGCDDLGAQRRATHERSEHTGGDGQAH